LPECRGAPDVTLPENQISVNPYANGLCLISIS
jgi:hypothetical protein